LENHITQVNKKVSRALFSIRQVKRVLPTDSLRTLYYSLLHSHFTYGIIAWGSANKSNIKPLVTLQKRAIRVIHNASYNSHTDPKFKSSGILKIPDLLVYQSLIFMFDYLSNKLPPSFDGTFTINCNRPNTRPTRQSRLFYIPRCHSAFVRKQPLYSLPVLWNDWAKLIISDNLTRVAFKRHVKSFILNKYPSSVRCMHDRCSECHQH